MYSQFMMHGQKNIKLSVIAYITDVIGITTCNCSCF